MAIPARADASVQLVKGYNQAWKYHAGLFYSVDQIASSRALGYGAEQAGDGKNQALIVLSATGHLYRLG